MKLLAPDIEEVVASDSDLFGRDQFAAGLLQVFSASVDPLVVALDEKWGSGKTVFAKRLARKATEDGFPVVYFDAFAHDYDPDVFLALASSALSLLPKSETATTNLKERAKSVGKVLGRVALKGAVRAASGGLLRASDLSEANREFAEDVAGSIEAELDTLIEQRLSRAKEEEQTFAKFREALSTLGKTSDDGSANRPLIFIIDELDRCRPDYALSVLETVKHFFSVPNVHFLVVCQLDQLGNAAKSTYGAELAADLYLEKFIHVRVNFPDFEINEKKRLIKEFADKILRGMPDDQEGGRMKLDFSVFISKIGLKLDYSLRRIERICTLFGLCMAFTNKRTIRNPAIIHILCDMKVASPVLFRKAKKGSLSYSEVKNRYEFSDSLDIKRQEMDWYAKNWRYFLGKGEELSGIDASSFSRDLFDYGIEREDMIRFISNNIVDRFAFPA